MNSVFRAAHTIKGSSGLFGLDDVVAFTHAMESVLDRLRSREIQVSAELVDALLQSKDHLAFLIGGVSAGRYRQRRATSRVGGRLGSANSAHCTDESDSLPPAPRRRRVPAAPVSGGTGAVCTSASDSAPTACAAGWTRLAFIRYLSTVGDIISVTTIADMLPAPNPWTQRPVTSTSRSPCTPTPALQTVAGVFEFVRDDSDIRVLTAESSAVESRRSRQVFRRRTPAGRYSTHWSRGGTIGAPELARPLRKGAGAPRSTGRRRTRRPRSAKSSTGGQVAPVPPIASGAAGPETADPVRHRTIRVDASRLDRLIDAVGELVIAGAGAGLAASLIRDEGLRNSISEVMRLVEEVRDGALQLRMVPIGTTFSRFQRVVRDVSADLGKDVGPGDLRRRDRGRQGAGGADRRPADAPGPQLDGPRHRVTRGSRGTWQAGAGHVRLQRVPRLGQHRHRGRGRRRRYRRRSGCSPRRSSAAWSSRARP